MNKNIYIVVSVIIVLVLLAGIIVFINANNSSPKPTTTTPEVVTGPPGRPNPVSNRPTQQSPVGENGNQDVLDYAIEMVSYFFEPNIMEAEAGQTLQVKLTSTDGTHHNFVIDELGVRSSTLGVGESETIEILIPSDASGKTYTFYCSQPGHRQNGQVGTLTIR
jgi:plastocyanin